jgi:hypothetical protein
MLPNLPTAELRPCTSRQHLNIRRFFVSEENRVAGIFMHRRFSRFRNFSHYTDWSANRDDIHQIAQEEPNSKSWILNSSQRSRYLNNALIIFSPDRHIGCDTRETFARLIAHYLYMFTEYPPVRFLLIGSSGYGVLTIPDVFAPDSAHECCT